MKSAWVAFILTGCGLVTLNKHETVVERGVDSAFFTYVRDFEYLSEQKVHGNVAMWFNIEVVEERAGECASETKEIRMNWEHWQTMDSAERENVVFHELAHCLLERNHEEMTATIETVENAPVSIMYPKTIDPVVYRSLRKYYHKELFNRLLPDTYYSPE